MRKVRIALAQIDTIVGDLEGNTDKILFSINEALKKSVDLILFPEMTIPGYPPGDLVLKHHFIKGNIFSRDKVASYTKDIIAVLGFIDSTKEGIYNAIGILNNKKVVYRYHKLNLSNYGVFDEKKYFRPGDQNLLLKTNDFSFCINTYEDIVAEKGTLEKGVFGQIDFIIVSSALPYHMDRIRERETLLREKAERLNTPIVYCNLIGGQDEFVFDGNSIVVDKNGKLIARARPFEEDLLIVELGISDKAHRKNYKTKGLIRLDYKAKEKNDALQLFKARRLSRPEEIYSALVLAVRDYVRKNNFGKVAIGLSGGIDSALVACIARDALSNANVLAIIMPSRYSSKETQEDAERICRNLGIRFSKVDINPIFDVYLQVLSPHFTGMPIDITEENIQARIRGNILMAFSNKFGYLVLNTGNKSELSVGYCTLYGDMAGGYAVLKDIPKCLVYRLAEFVNKKEKKEIIPKTVFERPPSAELKPGQKDEDVLPKYPLLDKIIDLYIERGVSFDAIVKRLGSKDTVIKVLRMIDSNEYKRRQAPLGIKITPQAFRRERYMPITNHYKEGSVI